MPRLPSVTLLLLAIGCSEARDSADPDVAEETRVAEEAPKRVVVTRRTSAMKFTFTAKEAATLRIGGESFGELPVVLWAEKLVPHFDPGLLDSASSFERIEEARKLSGGMCAKWNESRVAIIPSDDSDILLLRHEPDDGGDAIAGGLRLEVIAEDGSALEFRGVGSLVDFDTPWAPIEFGRPTTLEDG